MVLKDRVFLKEFNRLYWPIVLQNVVVLSVNLIDNIMLGAYSESALAGASSVNQIQFILQMVVSGFGAGLIVLLSQYWGQKRTEPIRRLTAVATLGSLVFAMVLFCICSLFPTGMLQIFTNDPEIVAEGVRYLRIMKFTFPVFAITTILQHEMQGVGTVRLALVTAVIALVCNLILNALLIPRWGVEGAAVATLAARVVSFICIAGYVLKMDKKVCMHIRDFFHLDANLNRDYIKVTVPLLITNGLWGVTTALQTVTMGHMAVSNGSGAIAAHSMANTLFSILKTASNGSASVANILVGSAVGRGDIPEVRKLSRYLQTLFLMIGVTVSVLLFVLRNPILSIYNIREETKEMADSFMLVLCITGMGTAYQMPVIMGIVRGGGDTRFGMINDLCTILGFVVPMSLLAAFVWNWPPALVFACQNSDQVIKCVAAVLRVNSNRWIKPLTRNP